MVIASNLQEHEFSIPSLDSPACRVNPAETTGTAAIILGGPSGDGHGMALGPMPTRSP
jgi:hypothetical protein